MAVSPHQYWQLLRLQNNGHIQSTDQPHLQDFLAQSFSDTLSKDPFDLDLQKQLVALMRDPQESPQQQTWAEQCLRCRISYQIYQTCFFIHQKYSPLIAPPFQLDELLVLVLDDLDRNLQPFHTIVTTQADQHFPLAKKILESYRINPHLEKNQHPNKNQSITLNTWVNRLVRHNPEITQFLLMQGIAMISPWALLNEATPSRLERFLLKDKGIAGANRKQAKYPNVFAEIDRDCELLRAYHQIYRKNRQENNASGTRCKTPTEEQLQSIADRLNDALTQDSATQQPVNVEAVSHRLEKLAKILLDHYIASRSGRPPQIRKPPSDDPKKQENFPDPDQFDDDTDHELTVNTEKLLEMLESAREKVLPESLDRSIAEFIEQRYQSFAQSRRKGVPEKAPQYWKALYLYFQKFQSLTEIAPQLGMRGQDNVTNLLELKLMRSTVRRLILNRTLKAMQQIIHRFPLETNEDLDQAIAQIQKWLDSPELPSGSPRLDAIAERIDQVLTEEASRSMDSRNRARPNLLTQSVCQYIQSHPDRPT
jgi:hypothetical protein